MNIKSLFNLQTTELDVYNHKVNGTIRPVIHTLHKKSTYSDYNIPYEKDIGRRR